MALAKLRLEGHAKPRVAPPVPVKSDVKALSAIATEIGPPFIPWQETAGRYLEGLAPDGKHLYQEVAILTARQNGKTTLLVSLIVKRLRAGRRIMHTAQNRELPREVFGLVADILEQDGTLFPQRNGRDIRPRFANGQEEIRLANGGRYRIVAPTRGGARGGTNDDVIVDELREMATFEFIGAAKPTMTASLDPQIIYLSNDGDEGSVVLNSVKERAGKDPRLAFLGWSAAPERSPEDRVGWLEANPAIGHFPEMLRYLEGEYLTNKLAHTLEIFETEHLCRSVPTMRERLVDVDAWKGGETELETQQRPSMAVSMDPTGKRASGAVAWPRPDGTFGLRLLFDVTGNPIDTDRLGRDALAMARALKVPLTGFDPLTDALLAKHFPRVEPITGKKYANASSRFVSLVESGKVKWSDAAAVGDDLLWTARKSGEADTFEAVRAQDDRPIPAVLASIRALWLASTPVPRARPIVRGF